MPELIHTDNLGNKGYWDELKTHFIYIFEDGTKVLITPSMVKALYKAWDNEIEAHTLKHQHNITPQETRNT